MKSEMGKQKKKDTMVYVSMTADFLHHGHINLIEHARSLGQVTVGLLTDEAVANKKRLPALSFEQRRKIIENLVGVVGVIEQHSWDYSGNISRLKPDFFVHGDDWTSGPEVSLRSAALAALESYGGQLVEIPYTEGVSSGALSLASLEVGTTPDIRRRSLRRLLNSKSMTRLIEAHSPLSALLAERASSIRDGNLVSFDGFWSSSLTDSVLHGKPDIEAFDISSRLEGVNQIFEVTALPLVFDGDTGGHVEHFEMNVRSMERLGISAVIIEDKVGLKRNSLFGNEVQQNQEVAEVFAEKISRGKLAQVTRDFMVIARVESLILEAGIDDALYRSAKYVEAGADGIMIHSRARQPDEVFAFSRIFRQEFPQVPLVCVPSTYSSVSESELEKNGLNVVIYANQLLRSVVPAITRTAQKILEHSRALEVEDDIAGIDEILGVIPGAKGN